MLPLHELGVPLLTMSLAEKAKENLDAVDRLLETADGDLDALANAAASRAYYAAYQAVVERALQSGLQPLTGATYYRHDVLPDHAFHLQLLTYELRESLVWLRDLRVKADYQQDQVEYDEASIASERAKRIVDAMLASEASR